MGSEPRLFLSQHPPSRCQAFRDPFFPLLRKVQLTAHSKHMYHWLSWLSSAWRQNMLPRPRATRARPMWKSGSERLFGVCHHTLYTKVWTEFSKNGELIKRVAKDAFLSIIPVLCIQLGSRLFCELVTRRQSRDDSRLVARTRHPPIVCFTEHGKLQGLLHSGRN